MLSGDGGGGRERKRNILTTKLWRQVGKKYLARVDGTLVEEVGEGRAGSVLEYKEGNR